jgi:hypothetical protein
MFANESIHAEDDPLDTSFELTDDKGVVLAAKMKIAFSLIPGSCDNIKEFMKRVDDDVSNMSSLRLPSSLSTLGQVLKLTNAIMDKVSLVHLSRLKLIIANKLIEVIRHTRYSMHRGPLFPVFTR